MKLFDHILDIAEDEESFVFILIDEVESIVSSRAQASKGNEPGDEIRVVNAVLMCLDKLKYKMNTLVLSTSNMIQNIDQVLFFSNLNYVLDNSRRRRFLIEWTCVS